MSDHTPDIEALKDIRDLATGSGAGPKIAAIKLYRRITGATLADSKEAVESWVDFRSAPRSVQRVDPDAKTAKVRIAVAVDPDGDWNSFGCKFNPASEAMENAAEMVGTGEARYWLTATLPIPKPVEVEAEVTEDKP